MSTTSNIRYQNADSSSIYNVKQNLNTFLSDVSKLNFDNILDNSNLELLDSGVPRYWSSFSYTTGSYNLTDKLFTGDFLTNGFIQQQIQSKLKPNTEYTITFNASSTSNFSFSVSASNTNQIYNLLDSNEINKASITINGTLQKYVINFKTASTISGTTVVNIKNLSLSSESLSISNICLYKGLIELDGLPISHLATQPNINTNIDYSYIRFNSQGIAVSGSQFTASNYVTLTGTEILTNKTITLKENPLATIYTSPTYYIKQQMGVNDFWQIYGEAMTADTSSMIIEVGDNGLGTDKIIFRGLNGSTRTDYLTLGSDLTTMQNLKIYGNLTVNGTTTTINSSIVSITDKTIQVGLSDNPDNHLDTYIDGSGITTQGTTLKSILWENNTNKTWTSSENFNVASGKAYCVDGTKVLDNSGAYKSLSLNVSSLNAVDLNDLSLLGTATSREFEVQSASHTPTADSWWYVKIYKDSDANQIFQTARNYSDDLEYTRRYSGSTWYPWVVSVNSNNISSYVNIGTVPISGGGTGATTQSDANFNLFTSQGTGSVAIGPTCNSDGSGSVVIGNSSTIHQSTDSILIGRIGNIGAIDPSHQSVVIGNSSTTNSKYSICVGYNSEVFKNSDNSIAIGYSSYIDQNSSNSIAIGNNTTVSHSNSTIIGSSVSSVGNNEVRIGNNSVSGTYLNGDVFISNQGSTHGFVIKDRTTNVQYRLVIDNGILMLEGI